MYSDIMYTLMLYIHIDSASSLLQKAQHAQGALSLQERTGHTPLP